MDYNLLWIGLAAFLILCCLGPMLMARRRRNRDDTRPPTAKRFDTRSNRGDS